MLMDLPKTWGVAVADVKMCVGGEVELVIHNKSRAEFWLELM